MSRFDLIFVIRFNERQAASFAQVFAKTVVSVLFPVLHNDYRDGEIRRELRQHDLQCR